MSTSTLVERRNRFLGSGAALFYDEPLHIVRGEGVWLHDPQGRRYMDMYNNVPCVGHANPRVVAAMQEQAGTLNVHSRYLHEGIVDFAQRLVGLHHARIESVVFACSGTEANEVAMTMARVATQGEGFICTDAAYHGNSQQVGALTHVPVDQTRNKHIRSIPYPQMYRPPREGATEAQLRDLYLDCVREAIEGFRRDGVPLAGMLVCPLLANEGLPNIPAGFMAAATTLVRDAGGLVIADEVQAGYCRSGQWWGYDVVGLVPDIVTMGKPMGNGLPLSAAAASRELVEGYRARSRYFNTFASSPLQAAVGMAVIDEIEQRQLAASAKQVGEHLCQALTEATRDCPSVGDVRGRGLFIGIECVKAGASAAADRDGAVRIVNAMKDAGFLMSNAGALGNVVKIRPPLVFERAHADEFLAAFTDCLQSLP
jgi:4-aminobutyrate aminotransferase-like enzyme